MQKKVGFFKKAYADLRHQWREILFIILVGICSVLIGKLILETHELPEPMLWGGLLLVLGLAVGIIYKSSFLKWPTHKKITPFTKIQFGLFSVAAIVSIDLIGAIAHHFLEGAMHAIGVWQTVAIIFVVFISAFFALEKIKEKSRHTLFEMVGNTPVKDFGLIVTLSLPRGEDVGFSKNMIKSMGALSIQQICSSIREVKQALDAEERGMKGTLSPDAKLKISAGIIGEELARLPIGNTAMYILGLEWLLGKATETRRLHIIASTNSPNAVKPDGSSAYIEDAKLFASHFGLNAGSSVISFDDPSEIYREVETILSQDGWYERPAAVDLTGGNKQSTFAGGVATVHEHKCIVLYVDTNTMEAKTWDPRPGEGAHVPDEL